MNQCRILLSYASMCIIHLGAFSNQTDKVGFGLHQLRPNREEEETASFMLCRFQSVWGWFRVKPKLSQNYTANLPELHNQNKNQIYNKHNQIKQIGIQR